MSIHTDRLREIADGAMGIGAPLVLTQAEQVEVCTELLACREENEKLSADLASVHAELIEAGLMPHGNLGKRVGDLAYVEKRHREDRDAARAEAEKLTKRVQSMGSSMEHHVASQTAKLRAELEAARDEVTQLEGMERQRDEAYATLDDVCKALGADVDSAVAQAIMLKGKAGELAAVKRQRDELLRFARDVRSWLADPKLSKWTYMEGSEFYADKDRFVYEADEAIARAQPEQPQQPQDGAP